jgi:hypothetical protein
MAKPLFSLLKSNHYSSDLGKPGYKKGEELYEEMGLKDFFIKNYDTYYNTCAARMSLALLKSGVSITGRLTILAGSQKGNKIETGAKQLADQLLKVFGNVIYQQKIVNGFFSTGDLNKQVLDFMKKPGCEKGVIFFNKLGGDSVCHIDLIEFSTASSLVCNSACYFMCNEVWYWPLP